MFIHTKTISDTVLPIFFKLIKHEKAHDVCTWEALAIKGEELFLEILQTSFG